jgi:hypothetical protein
MFLRNFFKKKNEFADRKNEIKNVFEFSFEIAVHFIQRRSNGRENE